MFHDIGKRVSKMVNARTIILGLVIVLMAVAMIWRLFYLQVVTGEFQADDSQGAHPEKLPRQHF